MKSFCFPPKYPTFRKEKSLFEWWSVWICLPTISYTNGILTNEKLRAYDLCAPTVISFESQEFWHSFKITFLGFGFGYARQWDY